MIVVAALVVPVMILEGSHPGQPWSVIAAVANWLIWAAFAFELIVMLRVAPNRRAYLISHPVEALIVFLTVPVFLTSFQSIRALRILRLLRLLRLAPLVRFIFRTEGLKYAALFALLVALSAGAAFDALEPHQSFWDGVYWAVTTMTTVGYGSPEVTTDTGKVVAVAVMLVGIGFLAIITGAVAERFMSNRTETIEASVEEVVGAEADLLAQVREISVRLQHLEAELERRSEQRAAS